jgi:glucose/arabinose dehydrogenase
MGTSFRLIVVTCLLVGLLSTAIASAQEQHTNPFAYDDFASVWERTDAPVAQLVTSRTWIWGPEPRSEMMIEDYVEAGEDGRVVQYFDKSRMERPWSADVDPDSPWFITQGLLATELMTGRLQAGDSVFEERGAAEIPVAGDADDVGGPTYAVMGDLMNYRARPTGAHITQVTDRTGSISDNPDHRDYGVTDAYFDEVTEHNIASVFWDFMNSTGTISVAGTLQQGRLFENPFYAVGRPQTEAYWASVKVGGEVQDVLIQCFERRCLTYAPGNPDGWQVESGNIGMHYQRWRYEHIDRETPQIPVLSTVTDDVPMPGAMTFADDGRMFFNEVFSGQIRVIEDGQLLEEPFATVNIARLDRRTEFGLLGLALDPDFEDNGYVYAFYTAGDLSGQPIDQRIVRFRDDGNIGVDPTVIVSGLPFGPGGSHNAGRMAFSPDKILYATIGDVESPGASQDIGSPAGSVLRYTRDGLIPDDNPFGSDNPAYAYGLRNPFGIAFHPETGDLFVTDNGPDGFEEVNRIVAGGNYGWPVVSGIAGDPDFIDPIWATGQSHSTAPTGMTIPTGLGIPSLAGQVLFCNWNHGALIALELDPNDPDIVVNETIVPVKCNLDVVEGPDGALYTSDAEAIYRYGPPAN